MAYLPVKTVVRGDPPSAMHRINKIELQTLLEEIQNSTSLGAQFFIEDSLADLNAIPTPAEGASGFVLSAPDDGTYRYQSGAWVQTAALPTALSGLSGPQEAYALVASTIHLFDRPGDAPGNFDLDGATVFTSVHGEAVKTGDPARIIRSSFSDLQPGLSYSYRVSYFRVVNPADPANDSVQIGVQFFDDQKNLISTVPFVTDSTLLTTSGKRSVSRIIVANGEPSGTGIFEAPAGAVYMRPYIEFFGTGHETATDFVSIQRSTLVNATDILHPGGFVYPERTIPTTKMDPQPGPGEDGGLYRDDPNARFPTDWQGSVPITERSGPDEEPGLYRSTPTEQFPQPWIPPIPITPLEAPFAPGSTGLFQPTPETKIPRDWVEADVVPQTLYVAGGGDDNNGGRDHADAFASIEQALAVATSDPGNRYAISCLNGIYYTDGHLDVPDNVTVIHGEHGQRSAIFRPTAGNSMRNVFRLGNGGMLSNISGEAWMADDPENPTEGALAAFRPGAVIFRTPYIYMCNMYRAQPPEYIPPPVDPENGNPFLPAGPCLMIADGDVTDPASIFPQMMAYGSTPTTPNGVGYCAKNRAFINVINAMTIWAHVGYCASNGGRILADGCGNQFGDITFLADGETQELDVLEYTGPVVVDPASGTAIFNAKSAIQDAVWNRVVADGYGGVSEPLTRRDAGFLVDALRWDVSSGQAESIDLFMSRLYPYGVFVAPGQEAAFISGWEGARTYINGMGISASAKSMVSGLIDLMIATTQSTPLRRKPSLIQASSHRFNLPASGVNARAFRRPVQTPPQTIIQRNGGLVQTTGIDDRGNQYFAGGLRITRADGKIKGRPLTASIQGIIEEEVTVGAAM